MEKTIVEKLNLLKYSKKAIINRPNESYLSEITDAQTEFPKEAVDLLFIFVKDMTEFKQLVDKVIENQVLNKEGVLFVAYPKREIRPIRLMFTEMKFFQLCKSMNTMVM